jgi:hypothetical protein
MATPLTEGGNHAISAAEIEFVPLLPEYPKTHPNGYAYVVNLRQMTEGERRNALNAVSEMILLVVYQ